MISAARRRPSGDRPTGGALGQRRAGPGGEAPAPSRPSASARTATAPARGAGRPPAPRRRCAPASSASSASSARVSAMLRSAAGLSSRSTGSTSARIRLRAKRGSRFVGSSRTGSPASSASSRTRSRAEARAAAARCGPRRGARPSSARAPGRDGEPVEHRLGEVGAGVAGRDPVGRRCARAAARPPRSAPRGASPGGCPPGSPRARRAGRCRSRAQSSPACPLVAVGVVAQPVVDVKGVNRPARRAPRPGPAAAAGRVRPAGDQHHHRLGRADRGRCARTASASAPDRLRRRFARSSGDLTSSSGVSCASSAVRGDLSCTGDEQLDGLREPLQLDLADRLELEVVGVADRVDDRRRSTITSPPSARATTRWVRLTSPPK